LEQVLLLVALLLGHEGLAVRKEAVLVLLQLLIAQLAKILQRVLSVSKESNN
jgi:hypothetical protein